MKQAIIITTTMLFLGLVVHTRAEEVSPGMVTITFDDASLSQYTNGLRIATQYNVPGTLFVVTQGVTASSAGEDLWYMNWEQVADFVASGWEIGSHSRTHSRLPELSPEAVQAEVNDSYRELKSHLGVDPVTLASPYGAFSDETVDAVMKTYRYHMRAWGGNQGRNPQETVNPRDIGRMNVSRDATVSSVCGEMLRTAQEHTWLVLIFHEIVEQPKEDNEYQLSIDKFDSMMRCAHILAAHDIIKLVTVREAMETWSRELAGQ